MRKITPLILIAIFCVSLLIPMAALPMETEVVMTTPEEVSIPAAEGDTGHELRIPIFQDETVENSTPDGNRDGDEFQGGLFVGLESNENILGRTFLKFDMRAYPANLGFQSAYLYVHLNSEYLAWDDQDVPIGAYYCSNDSWTDETITWNNQPSFSATPTDVIDSPASPDMFDPQAWFAWDITTDVTTALAGDRILTEVLKITDEATPSSCWKYFTESEYEMLNSSYIAIEYNEPVVSDLAVNGQTERPFTDYINPPGILTWDTLGDGPDEELGNYNFRIYDQPGATGSLIHMDSTLYNYALMSIDSTHARPFTANTELKFQFKYGDDLLHHSGVVDTIGFIVDTTSATMEFDNISILLTAVNNRDALTSDFDANYDGAVPVPVFYRDSYTATVQGGWVEFDVDNCFFLSERSSLIVELRWMNKAGPSMNSYYSAGLNGSVAYSYGVGAMTETVADFALDRTHAISFDFVSDSVAEDGSGLNGYPFGSMSQGVMQLKYNKSLLSHVGTVDKLYFGVDDFGNTSTLEDLRIWMAETPVEGQLGTTFVDNYGGVTPVLVMNEASYEVRNLGNVLEIDVNNVFTYTGEYDLLIELRFSSRTGEPIFAYRTMGAGAYRAGNTADHTATTANYEDEVTYDLDISWVRDQPIDLPDTLEPGEYYYARIRPCDTTGVCGEWAEIGFKYDSILNFTGDKIRVAIYDESNGTAPSWT
ncbi:MAG: CBM96 family carbohydrate-binding protein, partial [Candidatus Thorarchaeota archaeon]